MDPIHVASLVQLSICLEVASPKPGNVNRYRDFRDTNLYHFLASSAAILKTLLEFLERASEGLLGDELGVGRAIRDCMEFVLGFQRGGNTILGSLILLIPLSAAAVRAKSLRDLRSEARIVLENTTPRDSIELRRAILSTKPSWLGRAEDLDLTSSNFEEEVVSREINMLELMRISSDRDLVAREVATVYEISFSLGYPKIVEALERGLDFGQAVLQAFLEILSRYPDTFIARKSSWREAELVSGKARRIVDLGGVYSSRARGLIAELDDYLRSKGLNPGAVADVCSSSIFIALLSGARP